MTTIAKEASDRIREIAEVRTNDPVVVSLYVSLDASQFPTGKARYSQIESLTDEARALAADESLSHEGRKVLDGTIQRVREWAENELDPDGAQGIAIFAADEVDLFDVFRLSTPIGPSVHIGPTAFIEPLVVALPTQSWCVFLVNRRTARMFRGTRDRLIELGHIEDDVHGKHDQGGWSQARYQRSVEKEVLDHVQNACDWLFGVYKRTSFDKLLVACPSELWPEVESKLHAYLVDKLATHLDADLLDYEGVDRVLERVQPLVDDEMRREEGELIDRFVQQFGRGERAVSGLDPVLEALNMRSVEIMLLTPDFRAPGVVCSRCGWLGSSGDKCPVDSAVLENVSDVVQSAARAAVLSSASVREIRHHEPEHALGAPVAALLRF